MAKKVALVLTGFLIAGGCIYAGYRMVSEAKQFEESIRGFRNHGKNYEER